MIFLKTAWNCLRDCHWMPRSPIFPHPPQSSKVLARFQASSFGTGSDCYGSFLAGTGRCSPPPEMVQLGTMVLNKKGFKEKVLGSWRRALKARRQVGENSYVFPSSGDGDSKRCCREGEESGSSSAKITRIKKVGNGSFPCPSHSKSNFWASVYGSLKQVVPWSKREKKGGFMCYPFP